MTLIPTLTCVLFNDFLHRRATTVDYPMLLIGGSFRSPPAAETPACPSCQDEETAFPTRLFPSQPS